MRVSSITVHPLFVHQSCSSSCRRSIIMQLSSIRLLIDRFCPLPFSPVKGRGFGQNSHPPATAASGIRWAPFATLCTIGVAGGTGCRREWHGSRLRLATTQFREAGSNGRPPVFRMSAVVSVPVGVEFSPLPPGVSPLPGGPRRQAGVKAASQLAPGSRL